MGSNVWTQLLYVCMFGAPILLTLNGIMAIASKPNVTIVSFAFSAIASIVSVVAVYLNN